MCLMNAHLATYQECPSNGDESLYVILVKCCFNKHLGNYKDLPTSTHLGPPFPYPGASTHFKLPKGH